MDNYPKIYSGQDIVEAFIFDYVLTPKRNILIKQRVASFYNKYYNMMVPQSAELRHDIQYLAVEHIFNFQLKSHSLVKYLKAECFLFEDLLMNINDGQKAKLGRTVFWTHMNIISDIDKRLDRLLHNFSRIVTMQELLKTD